MYLLSYFYAHMRESRLGASHGFMPKPPLPLTFYLFIYFLVFRFEIDGGIELWAANAFDNMYTFSIFYYIYLKLLSGYVPNPKKINLNITKSLIYQKNSKKY